jgi:hypothetical protein
MGRWRSIACWPAEVQGLGNHDNMSQDEHPDEEAAQAVCRMLERDGFGGEGKIFPLWTRAESLEPATEPARLEESIPDERAAWLYLAQRWDHPVPDPMPPYRPKGKSPPAKRRSFPADPDDEDEAPPPRPSSPVCIVVKQPPLWRALGVFGLCGSTLAVPIEIATKMQAKLKKHLTPRINLPEQWSFDPGSPGNHGYCWPLNLEGAKSRAAFCRKMAELCAAEAAEEEKDAKATAGD